MYIMDCHKKNQILQIKMWLIDNDNDKGVVVNSVICG